jgi:hypothetical protein
MPGTESGDRDGAAGDCDSEAFPAGAMLDEHQDGQALEQHGVGVQEGRRRCGIPAAWVPRNCRHAGPERRGAGSMPAARRISQTVDVATVTPSLVSSPWIRRYPRSGFSLPAGRQDGGCSGLRAGGRACAVCSCPTSSRPAYGARPAASRASPRRLRSSAPTAIGFATRPGAACRCCPSPVMNTRCHLF